MKKDPKDKIINGNVDGYINFLLTSEEAMELIGILQFGISSSKFLAGEELAKGTYKNATKMNNIAHNADRILAALIATAQIGNPPSNTIN